MLPSLFTALLSLSGSAAFQARTSVLTWHPHHRAIDFNLRQSSSNIGNEINGDTSKDGVAAATLENPKDNASNDQSAPAAVTVTTPTSTTQSDDNPNATAIIMDTLTFKDSYDSISSSIDDTFEIVAARMAACLLESDLRRDSKGIHTTAMPSSATNWINEETASALRESMEDIKLKLPEERVGLDRDEASSWIRWMKSSPTPLIIDMSSELQSTINATTSDANLDIIEQTREQFLARLGCRLILLPSGAALTKPLLEPSASIIYSKLLYGGVTRYRLLASSNSKRPSRKAGERTDIMVSATTDNIPPWVQFGGPERMYEAVDIGAAAILEVMLLPRGKELASSSVSDMTVGNLAWKPQQIFGQVPSSKSNATSPEEIDFVTGYTPISLAGKDRNDAFQSDFQSSVGGLQKEIDAIVRRVLDGRVIRPASEGDNIMAQDETTTKLNVAAVEADELAALGLTPVRGLLLYGPPGCGKTALAREIAKALRARKPKIASAPELLDRWVGGSEKLVRSLFADAEAELAACNGDATKSALHVIVIDEIDAVFRRRSAGEDSGEATRASVVNQILAKLDGVTSIDNVLLIGMTNRRELLDEALLRPGRLEVQIEIPLPDQEGRREILQIHFEALRKRGRLSKPLRCAIDGVSSGYDSPDEESANADVVTSGRKRKAIKRTFNKLVAGASLMVRPSYDLASNQATGGFSGADIAGLVRCAGSLALSRSRKDGNGVDGLLVTLEDVKQSLEELRS